MVWATTLLSSIISVGMGAVIGLKSALVIARHNARAAAGAELRAAFAPEVARMRTINPNEWVFDRGEGGRMRAPKDDIETLLRIAFFERHAVAVEKYRFYVPEKDRAAYDGAWRAYYEEGRSICFTQYMVGEEAHALFHERMDDILEFTKEPHSLLGRLRSRLQSR